ncbi:hypothetical protein RC74_19010 [Falsihalocynthiibacter arcticus]|uniref:Uncharacterized protein n=1 Tax=Falsihalocynthiibacter arcticus TaxID=1579316 RepID=A0A126V426_9RHOB|nr:hypothetical protein RC74_19010 [Falsihalocynthiibacter arcticus]
MKIDAYAALPVLVQRFSGEKVISLILNCLHLIRRAFYGLARYSATVAAPKQSDRDYPFDSLQVFLIFPALFSLIKWLLLIEFQ